MDKQLIKVAKELNIGMVALVEFLNSRGFDVENKPNAKLSDEMYNASVSKFSDSKAEKLKADQLAFGNQRPQAPKHQQNHHHTHHHAGDIRTSATIAPERNFIKEDNDVDVIERAHVVRTHYPHENASGHHAQHVK